MSKLGEKILILYSAVASTALLVVFLTGAASHQIATFDELKVHRIDVVEPDGTLRLVISDAAQLPGVIARERSSPLSTDHRLDFFSTMTRGPRPEG